MPSFIDRRLGVFFFFNLGVKRTFPKYSFILCMFLEGALKLQGNIKEDGFMYNINISTKQC